MTADGPAEGARPARRGLVLGLVAVVLLAGVTYGVLRPSGDDPAAPARPTLSSSPPASPPSAPAVVDDDAGEWGVPAMTGETGLEVAGPSPRGVRVLDLDTGRTSAPLGPADPMVDAVAAIEGGWLVARREQCVDDGPCAPSEVFAVRGSRTRSLGLAHTILPDVDGRTVWLTRYPGTSAAEGRWLERRTYDGALTGARTRLRPYEDVEAVGPEGPVLGGEEAVVTLLRADSRERVPVVDHGRILGMVGRLVLWAHLSCDVDGRQPCAISTTEPGTGVTAEVVSLGDRFLAHAAVDPSGEHVAVATYDREERVEVVSYYVSTGRAEPVGTFPVSIDTLTWSPDGRWLVLIRKGYDDVRFDGHRIAVWAPGSETAFAAGTYPTESDGALAVGPAR